VWLYGHVEKKEKSTLFCFSLQTEGGSILVNGAAVVLF